MVLLKIMVGHTVLKQRKLYGGCKPIECIGQTPLLRSPNIEPAVHAVQVCDLIPFIAAGGAAAHAGHQHEVQLRSPDRQHALQARPHQPRDRLDSLRAGEGNRDNSKQCTLGSRFYSFL